MPTHCMCVGVFVLPQTQWSGSGSTVDVVAAVDAATADGVNVINFSVGSRVTPPLFVNAEMLAFAGAAAAGVASSKCRQSGPAVAP